LWAATAFAVLVFALRDLHCVTLLLIGCVLYTALLFGFGIVSTADVRSLFRQLNPNTVQSTND
jgi:hypothetical protein